MGSIDEEARLHKGPPTEAAQPLSGAGETARARTARDATGDAAARPGFWGRLSARVGRLFARRSPPHPGGRAREPEGHEIRSIAEKRAALQADAPTPRGRATTTRDAAARKRRAAPNAKPGRAQTSRATQSAPAPQKEAPRARTPASAKAAPAKAATAKAAIAKAAGTASKGTAPTAQERAGAGDSVGSAAAEKAAAEKAAANDAALKRARAKAGASRESASQEKAPQKAQTAARGRPSARAAPAKSRAGAETVRRRPQSAAAGPTGPAALKTVDVVVEGVRLHAVERAARRAERAIILIHGAGLDHRDWTFGFLDKLPQAWRVLAFDRPGFGGSERPRDLASALPATQARLLRGAARRLGVEQAILVGHSWGGAVAMAWGLDAPEETLGVASLAGAVAPWGLDTTMQNTRRIQNSARIALGSGGLRAAAVSALAEAFDPFDIPEGYVQHIATALSLNSGPTAATMADISTINGALSLMTPRYTAFARPVELVYGRGDRILNADEQGGGGARLLPDARLTLVEDVGHMVQHNAPDACLAAIGRLITGAAADRSA